MADEGFKRKLAAILSADVEGYSRLMDDDEAATVRTLTSYRTAISNLVQQYGGRVVDSPGDNILAEFKSVVDAVNCAVEIQCDLAGLNAELSDERKMKFRIGVNLGDVIEEEERIYGAGVNIAARLEGLADAAGICISGTAFDQVKGKLSLGYQFVGEQTVKNIPDPVRAYKVLMEEKDAGKLIGVEKKASKKGWIWVAAAAVVVAVFGLVIWQFYLRPPAIEPASVEKMAYPLPEKPSIAVLPFDNMSGDPAQEFFSDGITEDIITVLSKTDQLFVIARNSTFVYKGKPTSVKQIAEELGVRYVLEGSVRKSEDRVRITAQLIDAVKGTHLWAERYDRDLKDLFALQDEITLKIVTALQIKLTEGEQARLWGEKIENIDLKMKLMELMSLFHKGTSESYIRFAQLAQELIDMAPEFSVGYMMLATHHWQLAYLGKSKSPQKSMKKAYVLVQKAISLDDTNSWSHSLLGIIYRQMRQFDKAIAEAERAVALDPNGAFAHDTLGNTLCYVDRVDEGIDHIKQAIRLNPFPPYYYYMGLSRCYRMKGQYEEALAEIKKSTQLTPNWWGNYLMMAVYYALMDRQEEAAAATEKVLELEPNFSVERISKAMPYKNPAEIKIVIDAMRKAGFPE
jgi:adenylate cyclase